jgi:hypothetical protein
VTFGLDENGTTEPQARRRGQERHSLGVVSPHCSSGGGCCRVTASVHGASGKQASLRQYPCRLSGSQDAFGNMRSGWRLRKRFLSFDMMSLLSVEAECSASVPNADSTPTEVRQFGTWHSDRLLVLA